VVVTQALASVSAELLAASTSMSVAGAAVTMVIPVNRLNYIVMASAARLDTSGRFRFVVDEAVVLDAAVLDISKLTQSEASVADAHQVSFEPTKTDSVSFTEEFSKLLTYIRNFTDQANITEAQQFQVTKALVDGFVASDALALLASKALASGVELADSIEFLVAHSVADAITAGDLRVVDFDKQLSDTPQVLDSKSILFERPLADTFGVNDVALRTALKNFFDQQQLYDVVRMAVDKAVADTLVLIESTVLDIDKPLSDSLTLTEQRSVLINRQVIRDGVAMNDAADLEDGITFQATKSFMNMTFTSDQRLMAFARADVDGVATSDAGSLVAQGYCDLTYFAEDYVGATRTF
jgi:hypothetical protein